MHIHKIIYVLQRYTSAKVKLRPVPEMTKLKYSSNWLGMPTVFIHNMVVNVHFYIKSKLSVSSSCLIYAVLYRK